MSAIYNFNPQVPSDTLEERVFAIKRNVNGVLQNLTGATVVFEVYREGSERIWLTKAMDILDAVECVVRIPEIKNPNLTPYDYSWRCRITYADGDVKTYIGGELPIREIKNHNKWPIQ